MGAGPWPQSINFTTIPTLPQTLGTYSLEANATSGLGITFVSGDVDVATVSGNVLTLLQHGITTVTAKQAGNAIYDAAPDVTHVLTVLGVDVGPMLANPISDLNATEDDADYTIDLTNVFNDLDDDNSSITKDANSSNPSPKINRSLYIN